MKANVRAKNLEFCQAEMLNIFFAKHGDTNLIYFDS